MNHYHAAALSRLLVEHIRLARSRCETLGWLITSILTAGTVNLTRLAPYIDSAAQITSVHRRLERFFSPSYSAAWQGFASGHGTTVWNRVEIGC
jgi:hypothetical protein